MGIEDKIAERVSKSVVTSQLLAREWPEKITHPICIDHTASVDNLNKIHVYLIPFHGVIWGMLHVIDGINISRSFDPEDSELQSWISELARDAITAADKLKTFLSDIEKLGGVCDVFEQMKAKDTQRWGMATFKTGIYTPGTALLQVAIACPQPTLEAFQKFSRIQNVEVPADAAVKLPGEYFAGSMQSQLYGQYQTFAQMQNYYNPNRVYTSTGTGNSQVQLWHEMKNFVNPF